MREEIVTHFKRRKRFDAWNIGHSLRNHTKSVRWLSNRNERAFASDTNPKIAWRKWFACNGLAFIFIMITHLFSNIANEIWIRKTLASGDNLKIGCVMKHLVLCGYPYGIGVHSMHFGQMREIWCTYYINAILTLGSLKRALSSAFILPAAWRTTFSMSIFIEHFNFDSIFKCLQNFGGLAL